MCFSAGASFTASAILLPVGILAIKKAKFSRKLPFALIPVLFSVQQFSEGILWIALQRPEYGNRAHAATLFFLVFAQVVWPLWVPSAILLLEKEKRSRQFLIPLTIAGGLLAVFTLYRVLQFPVTATIDCRHIYYKIDSPDVLSVPVTIVYLLVTLLPPFISRVKRTNLLGIVIVVALIVSEFFYEKVLISVWCFFAAVLSIVVLYILDGINKEEKNKAL